jgi:hypothetical protein
MINSQYATVRTVLGVALLLAFAGCASTPASPDTAPTHPANANAASSTLPPLQPSLLTITNLVMVTPVTEPVPEHQHGHGEHGAKPKTEERK